MFWAEAAEGVDWIKPYEQVLDSSNPPMYRWFPGGELNTCFNALDRHVDNGRAEQTALIYDSPVTDSQRKFSYRELRDLTATFAGVLAEQGVAKGDRVIIYMPMVPEALIAMLACARLGAVHSVVFGGFAANELSVRIDDAAPKAIVSASCGIEGARVIAYKPLLDEAIELSTHKPDACVILHRPQVEASMVEGRDVDWRQAAADAEAHPCVPVAATDPCTSSTPRVRLASLRAWSGTTVATPSCSTGRCKTFTVVPRERSIGLPRMWGGWSAIVHRVRAVTRR